MTTDSSPKSIISFEKEDIRELPLPERLPERVVEAIGQAIGFGSLCWSPKPEGVFDSVTANIAVINLSQVIADAMESDRTRLAEAEGLLREIVAMDDSGDYNGRKIEDTRAFLEGSQGVSG